MNAQTTREHVRCPTCGKLSHPANYEKAGEHRLEVKIQQFGGWGKIQWFNRHLSPEEETSLLMFLQRVLASAQNQITARLNELAARPVRGGLPLDGRIFDIDEGVR